MIRMVSNRRSVKIRTKKPLNLGTFVFVLALILYFALGIFFIIFGQINADEGWYLYASHLVYEGQKPYQDFAYTQTPFLPYFYGMMQNLWPSGIYLGRITTFFLSTMAMFLSLNVAWRYAGKKASILTLLLWVTFPLGIYYQSITKTYALVTLLFMLVFFTLSSEIDRNWKSFFVTIFVLLATLTRLSALFFAIPILLYAFMVANNKFRIMIVTFCILSILWMAFLSFPNLEATKWNLVGHHTGQWGNLSLYEKLIETLNTRLPVLLITFFTYLLFLITLLIIGYKQIIACIRENKPILIFLIALALFTLPHFVSGGFHFEYFVTVLLCIFPVSAIFSVEIYEQNQRFSRVLLTTILLSTFVLGFFRGGFLFVDMETWRRPVDQVITVAEVVAENSDPDDQIYAMEALWIAVEADRYTVPNMSMAQFSFFNGDTAAAKSLNLINGQMTLEFIMNKVPKLVILTELDWQILEKTAEFESIVFALDEKYELLWEEDNFGQLGERVQVYLRKRDS